MKIKQVEKTDIVVKHVWEAIGFCDEFKKNLYIDDWSNESYNTFPLRDMDYGKAFIKYNPVDKKFMLYVTIKSDGEAGLYFVAKEIHYCPFCGKKLYIDDPMS